MIRDKDVIVCGAGAGVGVCLSPLIEATIESTYPTIPWLDAILPIPWARTSIFIPIVGGAIALAGGVFMENHPAQPALFGFGITALTSGFLKGVFNMPPTGRARTPLRINRRPVARVKQQQPLMMASRPLGKGAPRGLTQTGISDKVIVA